MATTVYLAPDWGMAIRLHGELMAEFGDGQPTTCHAEILATELHRRFVADR